ncbi:MAG: hypothetical protein ACYTFD_15995 [Planctomycetota bacterium]
MFLQDQDAPLHGIRDLRDHATEEYRDSMIENVPLRRDIMRVWEEHGGD